MSLFTSKVERMTPGQVLADASVAEFVTTLGTSIARAQRALDENAMAMAAELAQTKTAFSDKSLLELGLAPTFYQVVEAELEVKMTLSMRVEQEVGLDLGFDIGSGQQGGNTSAGAGAQQTWKLAVAGSPTNGQKVTLTVGGTPTELAVGPGGFAADPDAATTATNLGTALGTGAPSGVSWRRDGSDVYLTGPSDLTVTTDTGWTVSAVASPDVQLQITVGPTVAAEVLSLTVAGTQKDFTAGGSGNGAFTETGAPAAVAGALKTVLESELPALRVVDDGAELVLVAPAGTTVTASPAGWTVVDPSKPAVQAGGAPKQKKGAVAWGVSVDAHYHRRYEMEVTGSSSVKWKIVALPAPPAFMEELQGSLKEAVDA